MMDKEFIPYEQALELKELGFDKGEECLAYYNTNPRSKTPAFDLTKPLNHEYCLPAPLYQQAFRWFREKYGYSGIPNPFGYEILDRDDINYEWAALYEEVSNNYEEAELSCLKKLIEIVKNK